MVILDWRKNKDDDQLEVLIQWEGLMPEDATWENYQELQNTFPAFDLEDMVDPEEEGDVMDQKELGSDWD
ncbi:hypothetical protein A2U01_0058340, partial [Trifolium medium]|nr:hypothetical protein [Trifolium medium]